VKQRTIYTCEKCGLEIENDFDAMLKHEYSHAKPIVQAPEALNYTRYGLYPCTLIIKMNDGAKAQYTFKEIVEFPTEKESPQQED
jgi:hypothetical protein